MRSQQDILAALSTASDGRGATEAVQIHGGNGYIAKDAPQRERARRRADPACRCGWGALEGATRAQPGASVVVAGVLLKGQVGSSRDSPYSSLKEASSAASWPCATSSTPVRVRAEETLAIALVAYASLCSMSAFLVPDPASLFASGVVLPLAVLWLILSVDAPRNA